jgi:hypothetical protein
MVPAGVTDISLLIVAGGWVMYGLRGYTSSAHAQLAQTCGSP